MGDGNILELILHQGRHMTVSTFDGNNKENS